MQLRLAILAATGVLLYATIAGCTLWSARSTAFAQPQASDDTSLVTVERPRPAVDDKLPIRAVGIQVQRTDWIDRYKVCIDEAAELGADAVKIVVDARQEDGSSNSIYLDLRMTPDPDMLGELFRHAKGKGLKVIFMPIVLVDDPKGDEWRGTLRPESWQKWFESYRNVLGHFLWIAEGNGVDVFVIGSELLSSERQTREWSKTIAFVRERFTGLITYSSNWDHYENIPFWDQLDLIGMNSYWTLGNNEDASVDEIVRNWEPIKSDLERFVKKQGKPLMFLEVGWCSLDNAAKEPWDYTKSVPVNVELQKRLWQGFWRTWYGTPWLGGMSVWEWPPGDGGPDDRGYTPENKPAEDVIRDWFAKPAWAVEVK